MVDGHDRKILACHGSDHASPQPGTDDDMVGHDRPARSLDAPDTPVLDHQPCARRVGEDLELAGRFGLVDQLADDCLRTRRDQSGIRIPHCP